MVAMRQSWRRHRVRDMVLCLASAVPALATERQAGEPGARPNILLISVDDLNWDSLGLPALEFETCLPMSIDWRARACDSPGRT